MSDIVQIDGMWWPAADKRARPVILGDAERDVEALLKHTPGRTCIVQAGGNVGTYPLALADHFRRVVTLEPDPVNLLCLRRNLAARDSLRRVLAYGAALGEAAGWCGVVEVEAGNCGAHRISENDGNVPVVAIDALGLTACDAIWLDIEGYELAALKGARETLRRFRPTVMIEDKGLDVAFGVERGQTAEWVRSQGYHLAAEVGRDKIFRSNTQ